MSKENRVSDARLAELLLMVGDPIDQLTASLPSTDLHFALTELQSLRSKPVAGVEVKPLEWKESFWNRGDPENETIVEIWEAFGAGRVQGWVEQHKDGHFYAEGEQFDTLDEAKAAVQSSHVNLVLSTLSLPAQEPTETRILYRHHRRGTVYELIGIGKMQAGDWHDMSANPHDFQSVDMREVAVYRSVDHPDEIWVRPRGEFEDGRFEILNATLKEA